MRKYISLVLVLCLLFGIVGCKNILDGAKQVKQTAEFVKQEVQAILPTLERQADSLPPGDPLRIAIEQRIAQAKEKIAQADKVITGAGEVIASIEAEQATPNLIPSLSFLPYGAYVGFGLSLVIAVAKHFKQRSTLEALVKVVKSWEEVGAELTSQEKSEVRMIQGEKVTAVVDQIRHELANK